MVMMVFRKRPTKSPTKWHIFQFRWIIGNILAEREKGEGSREKGAWGEAVDGYEVRNSIPSILSAKQSPGRGNDRK